MVTGMLYVREIHKSNQFNPTDEEHKNTPENLLQERVVKDSAEIALQGEHLQSKDSAEKNEKINQIVLF
jgi:hypothetical protein